MRYWFGTIPARWKFSLKTSSQFYNGFARSPMAKFPGRELNPLGHGSWFGWTFSHSTNLFRLFFLHLGLGFCFLFFLCLTFGAPFDSEQMDGWLDFLFLYIPKIQAYFTFDGTLVFNDCMEWVNFALGGGGRDRLVWHGQKIPFPLPRSIVPLVAIKRGTWLAEIIKDFPYMRDWDRY